MGNTAQQKPQDTRIQRAADRANELRKRGKPHCQAVSIAASEFGLEFGAIQRELVKRSATHRAAGRLRRQRPAPMPLYDGSPVYAASAGALPAGDR